MSNLLTVKDLEAAKKHDTFHSEVITGKKGGVAVGAPIDYATNAVTGQQQKTLPAVLRDIGYQQVGTFAAGYTLTNTMQMLLASTGRWYSWAGVFPVGGLVVAPGTDPLSDTTNWIDRTEDQLREDLNGTGGASMVKESGGQTIEEYLVDLKNKTPVLAQRQSFNSLPRLLNALATYNESADTAINIIGLGSSVGVGASLPDPSTQAPVKYFASKLKAALDVGNIFNIQSYNYSVNGSTISEYSAPLEQAITDGKSPSLVVLAYGMNDAGVAIFNSGQTYPAIYTNAVKLIQQARELGSDVVIITTPHHRCNAVTYYMPDGIHQQYPVYVAAPVSPESLVPPASQSNITGDFTGSGKLITVSHRHLRVNQMFRKIASDLGCAVIDAEFFWFKALEEYGEDALFNAGEYLHPNLLGHQQSYHAAIDYFIEGLQRQTSQGVEPQLFGNIGINTQSPSGVIDIQIPYTNSPKDTLIARARTGVADSNGVNASGIVWKVESGTGDLVGYVLSKANSSPIEAYRFHGSISNGSPVIERIDFSRKSYGGKITEMMSGGFNLSGMITIFDLSAISTNCAGKLIVHGYHNGIGREYYEVNFVCKSGLITLGTPSIIGDTVFSITTSGSTLKCTAIASGMNFNWDLKVSSGV